MIYIIHILRTIKKFLIYPKQFVKLISSNINKDFFVKTNTKKPNKVLVVGVPKSGTTLIEWILSEAGYVNLTISSLRIFNHKNLKHPHDLSYEMLKHLPDNKFTFLKRHAEATKLNLDLIEQFNLKVIVSTRNLKDIMISRYLHMITDNKLPQYKLYKNLNYKEGFKVSLLKNPNGTIPIQVNNNWIKNWKKFIENKNSENFCELNYDDYSINKKMYIEKILNFINIDDSKTLKKIHNEHLKHLEILKNKSLGENLNSLHPQTFNIKSNEVRKILNTNEINSYFEDCLKKYN